MSKGYPANPIQEKFKDSMSMSVSHTISVNFSEAFGEEEARAVRLEKLKKLRVDDLDDKSSSIPSVFKSKADLIDLNPTLQESDEEEKEPEGFVSHKKE